MPPVTTENDSWIIHEVPDQLSCHPGHEKVGYYEDSDDDSNQVAHEAAVVPPGPEHGVKTLDGAAKEPRWTVKFSILRASGM